jgi:hypothetical protein
MTLTFNPRRDTSVPRFPVFLRLLVAALVFLASTGAAAAACATGGSITIDSDCSGDISATGLTVDGSYSVTVTGNVTGSGAFASNTLTLKHVVDDQTAFASDDNYASITGSIRNFGKIELYYEDSSYGFGYLEPPGPGSFSTGIDVPSLRGTTQPRPSGYMSACTRHSVMIALPPVAEAPP